MPAISYRGQVLSLEEGESVLDGLRRHGVERPSSCRSGVCQTCIMRASEGTPPASAQVGLKPAWREAGLFLPCVAVPDGPLTVDEADALPSAPGRVAAVDPLAPGVLLVRLRVEGEFACRPGQFVSLVRPEDGLTRPYSIAGIGLDGLLELHVAVLPRGRMSNWLRDAAGAEVQVRGPSGECYYQASSTGQPLLLAGTGTGLAPLWGVVREALERGHTGPIHLYQGSRAASGLYLREALDALVARHDNFRVTRSVLEDDSGLGDAVSTTPLDALLLADHASMSGYRVYLCGNPELVAGLKKKAFLAGANLPEIHSDPFVLAPGGG